MSAAVLFWWTSLCAIAAFNLAAWGYSARLVARRRHDASHAPDRRLQLMLSAVYVFGCAYRCVFPVYDVPRLGMVDSFLSSVLVGRSVATCAELCFVAQWALMLREVARAAHSITGKVVALALVPLIAIAETCSWYSVLTTSNAGHVIEESLWALAAGLSVWCALILVPRQRPERRRRLLAWCAAGVAYVAYMVCVDVPMYFSRWVADQAAGRHPMTLSQGLHDVATRWGVSHQWADWRSEVIWMTLYFSVGVWISLSLIHAPAHPVIAKADTWGRRVRRPATPLGSV